MGKIVVSENVTLDGVVQDPAGDEGFRAGGWVGLIKDSPQLGKLALDEALGTEALLLGRRSYEWFAARWPSRSGELANRLNSLPKYVVSSTLERPGWNNSTVLNGDVLAGVSKLKHELTGEILVPASFQLVHALMEHDLVDELRLKVFPVVLGPASACSARPATRNPCAWPAPRPSRATLPSSPTSASETSSGAGSIFHANPHHQCARRRPGRHRAGFAPTCPGRPSQLPPPVPDGTALRHAGLLMTSATMAKTAA